MSDLENATYQTLTHWGAYQVESASGTVSRVHPFPDDPNPSQIGNSLTDVDKCRVAKPSARKSWLEGGPGTAPERRGAEEFVEIEWERALDLVADELDRVRTSFGNQAIYAGSYGWGSAGRFHHTQSQIHRFANAIGGYTRSVNTYSLAAAEVILPHVIGLDWWEFENSHTSWKVIERETEFIVAFGGIPLKNSQVQYGGVGQHNLAGWLTRWAESGTQFVNVSPVVDDLPASVAPEWLQIRPGTDAALMLGLIHTLIIDDSYDRDFVDDYCVGWDSLVAHVTGKDDGIVRDAAWASSISSIPEDRIRSLARSLVEQRSLITVSWSLQRADHGEHIIWTAIALAAAVGQIGLPGGGFGIGYGAVATIGNGIGKTWLPAFEQGSSAVDSFIPVARIADMLLHPGEAFTYDGTSYTYPDIKLVYWAGGNPFHHHQDLNRLRRAWQRPDTIVVNEPFWTATAKHADIVLPATTVLERNDIGGAPNDSHLFAMQQAIAPVGGARNDYDIFSELATRLGVADAFTEGRTSDEWVRHLYSQLRETEPDAPPFEAFWEAGFLDRRPAGADRSRTLLDRFRDEPSANPLATPSGRIELYSEAIASFGYEDCPPHPTWLEPREWLGKADDVHDLHLITNQPTTRLHSQWDHGVTSRNAKVAEREAMRINPQDAAARGIDNGDVVRVFNSRGACLAGATVSAGVRQGVVELPTGAWYSPSSATGRDGTCLHGNPNTLTSDLGTSNLARGPAAQTCLVQVEKWTGEVPEHTAFRPPQLLPGGQRTS